ncbi:hypothetical protein GUJ93_ZPchr0001g32254 [Zizania palustris]|uniref:Uncharacterized protein n=1 Tax=Zizania palustris TaxID=103762 RepID=A0A8J5VU79_ZIZPA|nr:hypothetical protein GUJ93_ZPchr0001g32254 [Zizania palustris]
MRETILVSRLELRFDLLVHFITEKTMTKSDLDPHQNRFRLLTDTVQRRLLPILTADEAAAANLQQDIPRRVRARGNRKTATPLSTGSRGHRRT